MALVPHGSALRLVDYATGAFRTLAPRSANVLVGGPGVAVPSPVRNTPETVAVLDSIAASGPHDFTVRVYPTGAHSLRRTRDGLIAEELRSPGFVPGLFRDLAAWLRAHA